MSEHILSDVEADAIANEVGARMEEEGMTENKAVASLMDEPLEPGMVAVSDPINQLPPLPQMYGFKDMERMRKERKAQVIYRLGEFRKQVLLVGADWYEEKYDMKTGLVRYFLCSPERKAEILEQVRK